MTQFLAPSELICPGLICLAAVLPIGPLARRERPTLQVLAVPDAINVSARYGMALINPDAAAQAYVRYLLGPRAMAILSGYGFSAS